jgi:hypothetical protein
MRVSAMRLMCASLLATFAICDATDAWAKAPQPIWGVYSDVHYIKEADDLVGLQIELVEGPVPSVIMTICEGECRGGKPWPLVIEGNQLRFSVQDSLIAEGEQTPRPPVLYRGTISRSKIILTSADLPEFNETLKRLRRPRPFETALLGCHRERC